MMLQQRFPMHGIPSLVYGSATDNLLQRERIINFETYCNRAQQINAHFLLRPVVYWANILSS